MEGLEFEDYKHTVKKVVIQKKPDSFVRLIIKPLHLKGKKRVIIPIAIVTIFALIGIHLATIDWQLIADERKASSFTASEEVKTISNSLYFTRKGRAVFFASQPKLLNNTDFNKTCGRDGVGSFTSGCYYKDSNDDKHIEIFNVGTSTLSENGLTFNFAEYRKSVALHETLHAVWERFDENKKSSVCNNLKVISNQIDTLKQEMSLYNDKNKCTELFARIGSEYVQILSPKNSIPSSATVPVKYSSLNVGGKNAISELVGVYDEYFDTTKYNWTLAFWQNETQLKNFESKVLSYANSVKNKERSTRALISQYYYWPTWSRYFTANNAIREYNAMISTYNSYIKTYNKIISKLDSEQTKSAGSYLAI